MRHRETECRIDMPPQGNPNKCKRGIMHERLQPGTRKLRCRQDWTRQRSFGRLERHIPWKSSTGRTKPSQKVVRPTTNQPRTLAHTLSPYPTFEEPFRFHFEAHTEGAVSSWEM